MSNDLYTDIILDHYRHPRNSGKLKRFSARVVEYNPLCGDTIHLDILFSKEGKVKDIKFLGEGCALSQASASMISEKIKNKSIKVLKKMNIKDIQKMMSLELLTSSRISCISLSLQALYNAIQYYEKKGK